MHRKTHTIAPHGAHSYLSPPRRPVDVGYSRSAPASAATMRRSARLFSPREVGRPHTRARRLRSRGNKLRPPCEWLRVPARSRDHRNYFAARGPIWLKCVTLREATAIAMRRRHGPESPESRRVAVSGFLGVETRDAIVSPEPASTRCLAEPSGARRSVNGAERDRRRAAQRGDGGER